ncbi:hypothetical protein [Modestobacter lapidis]
MTQGKLDNMRDIDDDHRDDDQQAPEPAATETHAQAAVVARMLANPRRTRRA